MNIEIVYKITISCLLFLVTGALFGSIDKEIVLREDAVLFSLVVTSFIVIGLWTLV